jgi:hypothetical protein
MVVGENLWISKTGHPEVLPEIIVDAVWISNRRELYVENRQQGKQYSDQPKDRVLRQTGLHELTIASVADESSVANPDRCTSFCLSPRGYPTLI